MKVVINMVYMQSDRDPGLLLVNPNYNLKMSHIFKLVPQVEVRVARRAGTAARTAPQRRALPAIAAGAFTCHHEDRVSPAERVLARRSAGFHYQPCLCSRLRAHSYTPSGAPPRNLSAVHGSPPPAAMSD